jgi:hypothetical protein
MDKPTTRGDHSAYYEAITRADEDLEDALSHIRARQDDREISVAEACAERAELLERHLAECQRLRREHLGGN